MTAGTGNGKSNNGNGNSNGFMAGRVVTIPPIANCAMDGAPGYLWSVKIWCKKERPCRMGHGLEMHFVE